MKKVAVASALAMSQTGVAARKFWTSKPADPGNVLMTAYTIGNGRQGGLPLGIPGNDLLCLNDDSLWRGGPFANSSYTGGNPSSSLAHFLPGIQEAIFQNGTGDESALYGGTEDYGSYEALANLTVSIAGVTHYSKYKRTLDLETALHSADFTANGASFSTVQFCSFPDQVCVYHVSSNKPLPEITFGLVDNYRTNPPSTVKCSSDGIHLSGRTVADEGEGLIGMKFDAQAHILSSSGVKASCNNNGQTVVHAGRAKSVTIVVASGTEYDPKKGNAAHNYSFRGADPYPGVLKTVKAVSKKSYSTVLSRHVKDHGEWFDKFTLDLPDPNHSADVDTTDLLTNYKTEQGDPFVENLLVDYGKYMFIASSRPGSLPPNLQGSWAPDGNPAWSSDYHIDVNVQMNHWHVEKMGLGGLTDPLWDFMTYTWVPRGSESARLWYNVSGWVAFTNLNIFGHTGQMNDATWSNVAHDIAWMMAHVWDRYDYGRDKNWYASVGYPMMKGVASFWVDMLVQDKYFNDGTLVANPCNSPEQGPTTFGCSQFQQVIWELFDHIIKDWDASGDKDTAFLKRVKESYSKLDPEWKMDIDVKNNTHRHLSHLYGFYPGYVISSAHADNETIMDAVATSLYSRGNGTEDSNTGWEKVWRGACWGQLGVTDEAYKELKYAIDMNFAANGLSVYTTGSWPYEVTLPFQIDANFGLSANALAMLYTDLPRKWGDDSVQKVVLGPAIPREWAGGSVRGGSLRGGGTVDFGWDNEGVVNRAVLRGRRLPIVVVNKHGKVLARR
ncbi:putative alpha-fucosidase A [Trichoderma ghanense]|uniref:Alpha-fucosidase A n=1 Tax=Trichoderma ghanense TaxID=65468 RepID=A0ABY2GZH1_9HYPO